MSYGAKQNCSISTRTCVKGARPGVRYAYGAKEIVAAGSMGSVDSDHLDDGFFCMAYCPMAVCHILRFPVSAHAD